MADNLTPPQRHLNMSHIHGKDTEIELLVRKRLHADGFRYRVNAKELPGKPDILLPRYRTVIFVNGCFWHGHKGCKLFVVPQTNTGFWTTKIERNRARDDEMFRQLEALQWNVAVVWECELRESRVDATIAKLEATIRKNGERWAKEKADRRLYRKEYSSRMRQIKERAVFKIKGGIKPMGISPSSNNIP